MPSMSNNNNSHSIPSGPSARPNSAHTVSPSIDLVAAARRHLALLKSVAGSSAVHHRPTAAHAVRRYKNLWMPLIAELSSAAPPDSPPMIVPPPDVRWVWHCHRLDTASYRDFCVSRFGDVIEPAVIADDENEEYADDRCREIWADRYPSEPFDLNVSDIVVVKDSIFDCLMRFECLCCFFSDPFIEETVYLVAAKNRYLKFVDLVSRSEDRSIVPTGDIMLMWLTHKSFPRRYAKDMEEVGDLERRVVGFGEVVEVEVVEETRRAWEEAFDEPYEKAGAVIEPRMAPSRAYFNWEVATEDVNRRYRGLRPRFLMEVYVYLRGKCEVKGMDKKFLRLSTVKCHRKMKLDRLVSDLSSETWHKAWHLYCEFGTKGIALEIRKRESGCFRNSKLIKDLVFFWNDLLRSTTLSLNKELDKQVRASASVTPPVQAPYLLKCVPDRVTDDNGTMISEVVLRMNRYRPQEGRWLTRTVLDHARRECFVIRMRVGRGIWRRGAETPTAVKLEERIIEIREGPWSYLTGSVGTAPEKIVGSATPKNDLQEKKATWSLSTGDTLMIQWADGLDIQLHSEGSNEEVKLLLGRKLQYEPKNANSSQKQNEEEEHFMTLIRYSFENPDGKATALFNWKLLALELSPEEDAVIVLLVCMAVVRTISAIRKEDVSGLLVRTRVRELKGGIRDWGSVILPSSANLSPHLQPWYWDAESVLSLARINDFRQPISNPADGKDVLYKNVIIS